MYDPCENCDAPDASFRCLTCVHNPDNWDISSLGDDD